MYFQPPYPPYDPTDREGFSYTTVNKRWPVILAGIVDSLSKENHELFGQIQKGSDATAKAALETKLQEGMATVGKVSKIKYEMATDRALGRIPEDGEGHVELYNTELDRLAEIDKNTWYTAPWLFAECYLYRLLRSLFVQSRLWKDYDPFMSQKLGVFKNSSKSLYQLASVTSKLDEEKEAIVTDPSKLSILFDDMFQMCLWGNATDLSLLTHHSLADIEALQSVGKDSEREAFILQNDQRAVWEHVQKASNGRLDIVLDNAGFELFTDFVFADFLVTYTPHFSKAVFHPKLIPWFVSDVTPPDFASSVELLLDPTFLPAPPAGSEAQAEDLKKMVLRWRSYIANGTFQLSVPKETPLGGSSEETVKFGGFWTTSYPFWDMKLRAPELWEYLRESQLVVFKGDLNYRKLTGDIQWPAWTPFETAIGPLAGSFPILSLRTNKADVIVGIEREVAEKHDKEGIDWRVSGKYAVVSFLNRSG